MRTQAFKKIKNISRDCDDELSLLKSGLEREIKEEFANKWKEITGVDYEINIQI